MAEAPADSVAMMCLL